ncbi:MAG: NnrS family protein, partial [Gallionellaceae bacterium]|nr:NnrS family protein [Gallionellaceae bacterium]
LFIISLPFFLAGKNMLLSQEYYNLGWSMTLGLFRLAFVIMLERTLTQFMKAAFQVNILRNKKLDFSIKLGTLAAVFASVMPVPLAIAVLAVTATLLLIRFFFWSPLKALTRLDNGVMHVGYLALVASLYLECLQLAGMLGAVGNVAAHTFTLLCLGPIIPAMLVRIVQGHTGRKIIFTTSDKIAIWACGLGGFIRLVPPQIWPSSYQACIVLSALGWVICYALIGWRLVPFMLKPRIDGKEH